MKRSLMIIISAILLVSLLLGSSNSFGAKAAVAYKGYPTFSIVSVVTDKSVTIKTYNFPANDTFKVLMNYMGTRGVNGIVVDTIDTGAGGSFKVTFPIPKALKGQYQIAIRLQSPSSGYYAYNWFYNNTKYTGTGGAYNYYSGYYGYPYITVLSVAKNKSVTLKITNLPASDKYKVLLGKIGTLGVNGVNMGTFTTGSGGTKTIKVKIPSSLQGKSQIAVRIQSIGGSGYYAYNWFYNK
ncbi:MAG: hypothetical protein ACPL3P_00535 [Anaerolineales bacterium]